MEKNLKIIEKTKLKGYDLSNLIQPMPKMSVTVNV